MHEANKSPDQETPAYKHAFLGNGTDLWKRLRVGGKKTCSRSIKPSAAPVRSLEWIQQAGKLGQLRQFSKWSHGSQRKGKYCIFSIRRNILHTARHRQTWLCFITFHIFHYFMWTTYFKNWITMALRELKEVKCCNLKNSCSRSSWCNFFLPLDQTFGNLSMS